MSKPVYEAVFKIDDNGSWFVAAPEVRGAHTHGQTLRRARNNIREVLALVLDVDEDAFDVKEVIELAPRIRRAIEQARRARQKIEEAQRESVQATSDALRHLKPLSLSLRDTADLLGISFQRVQQLVADQALATGKDRPPTAPGSRAVASRSAGSVALTRRSVTAKPPQ